MTHSRSCNVCLNEYVLNQSSLRASNEILCRTCNEGYICNGCIAGVDPTGSIFLPDYDSVVEAIKCACCRTPNWNYHYNQVVCVSLDYDPSVGEGDWNYDSLNAAKRIFLRNAGHDWLAELDNEYT